MARTPIVAMTAHAIQGYRERCIAGGMDGYISKPIRIEALRKVIDEMISRRDSNDTGTSASQLLIAATNNALLGPEGTVLCRNNNGNNTHQTPAPAALAPAAAAPLTAERVSSAAETAALSNLYHGTSTSTSTLAATGGGSRNAHLNAPLNQSQHNPAPPPAPVPAPANSSSSSSSSKKRISPDDGSASPGIKRPTPRPNAQG